MPQKSCSSRVYTSLRKVPQKFSVYYRNGKCDEIIWLKCQFSYIKFAAYVSLRHLVLPHRSVPQKSSHPTIAKTDIWDIYIVIFLLCPVPHIKLVTSGFASKVTLPHTTTSNRPKKKKTIFILCKILGLWKIVIFSFIIYK